ncbi:uncharacterized protein LOC124140794 [Haliotis rufescens]|uniref:uncharacterized protein LOC124140794 n=1 Tax=Haliotis rufescens TaxID=6454 RepID=UPI00201EE6C6|nr:uncharacterized protein LOC124140794 [Haliotis rufescens]
MAVASKTRGGLHFQGNEQCDQCERLRRRIHAGEPVIAGRCLPQTCMFKLHWDVSFINPPTERSGRNVRKAKRLNMCETLAKYVTALMNSHGGSILIHLAGLSDDDFYHGFLDEMVSEKLHSLLQRGKLYSNAFKIVSLGELEYIYREYVLFCVNGSLQFVTQALNTCVALDDRILEAPTEVVSDILMSKPQARKMTPKIRGTRFFKETQEVQFKRFKPPSFLEEDLKNNPEKVALYIWEELGLREYLTAFAKLPEGGSYFLGVGEKEMIFQRYKTKKIEFEGIPEGFVDERVMRLLKKFFSSRTLFCDFHGEFGSPQCSNFITHVHHNELRKTVLECSIAQMSGLLFYVNSGPVSYQVQNGKLRQVMQREWFDAITRKHLKDGSAKHRTWDSTKSHKNLNRKESHVVKTLIERVSELHDEESNVPCFTHIEESIRSALKLSPGILPPRGIIHEAVILIPNRFGLVLAVCHCDSHNTDILTHTCLLGRDLAAALRHYTSDNFVFLTEVVSISDIESRKTFTAMIKDLETYAYSICIPDMFGMRDSIRQHLIRAIRVCTLQGDKDEHERDETEKLMKAFREYHKIANKVCERLSDIAKDIDELEQNKRLTKVICASTGLIGAAMSISGFIILGPLGVPVALAGAVVGISGGVGDVAASIVVQEKTKANIKEAKKHLTEFENVCKRIKKEMSNNEVRIITTLFDAASRAVLWSIFNVMDDIVAAGLKVSKALGVFLSALLVPLDVYKLISNVVELIERRPSAVAQQLRIKVNEIKEASKLLEDKKSLLANLLTSERQGSHD